MKIVDFSETIEACDLKVGRYRQLIEIMKVCEGMSRSFHYHIFFQVLFVLCFTRPNYQVSVYRTIVPLVCNCYIIVFSLVDFKPGGRGFKSRLCQFFFFLLFFSFSFFEYIESVFGSNIAPPPPPPHIFFYFLNIVQ